MKKVTAKQHTFKIVVIEIIESILNQPPAPFLDGHMFQFDISLEQRIISKENAIIVICTIGILNDNRDQQLSRVKSSVIFEVVDLENYTDKKSGEVNLPEEFRVSLNSIAISTSRGIMFSFLRGTYLHNAILPIVNPSAFKLNVPD